LPPKSGERALGRTKPHATASLRRCKCRLLAQRCGVVNQFLGLTQCLLCLGHLVPVLADCSDKKQGVTKPLRVAQLPI
jgi:hypothetical protein